MRKLARSRVARLRCGLALLVLAALLSGCTGESLRVALAAQQRADAIQQGILERQHDGLKVLLYRDTVRRMEDTGYSMTIEQLDTLNDAWNERDLVEFWALQNERAKALRVIGVDAKLYGDQAPVDLLIKSLERRADRVDAALAERAGRALTAAESTETSSAEETR